MSLLSQHEYYEFNIGLYIYMYLIKALKRVNVPTGIKLHIFTKDSYHTPIPTSHNQKHATLKSYKTI